MASRRKRVFISFDYEHDNCEKGSLVSDLVHKVNIGIDDISISEPIINERWQNEARRRIEECDCVIFLCGKHTHQAKGVEAEMTITKQLNKRYYLVRRGTKPVNPPINSSRNDKIYKATIKNLVRLMNGELE